MLLLNRGDRFEVRPLPAEAQHAFHDGAIGYLGIRDYLRAKAGAADRIGIFLALFLRLALLSTVAFIVKLTTPVFSVFGQGFSWRDLILIAGGLFLVYKAVTEIHHKLEGAEEDHGGSGKKVAQITFASVITQPGSSGPALSWQPSATVSVTPSTPFSTAHRTAWTLHPSTSTPVLSTG